MAGEVSLLTTVFGKVQGVFYRNFVSKRAAELRLTGYVRNLPDGAVEVRAEGEKAKLEQLLVHLEKGPTGASVGRLTTAWSEATGEYSDFQIKY